MSDKPILTHPPSTSDKLFNQKFVENIIGQSEVIDKLSQQLITLKLAMSQRRTFECWNCKRTYGLYLDIQGKPKLTVECPYCGEAASADLSPYHNEVKVVHKDPPGSSGKGIPTLSLPEVIPTQPPND